jgi:hypothetical protein
MSEIFVQGMFKWRARVRDKAYFVACRAGRCAGTKAAGGRSGREEKFRGWPFSFEPLELNKPTAEPDRNGIRAVVRTELL